MFKKTQKEHTFTVDGLTNGGLIFGIIYSLANGWSCIRGGGGLKFGRALQWDFTVLQKK